MKTNEPIEIGIHIPTSYLHKVDYVSTTQQQQQLDSAIYIVDDPTYIYTRSVHNKTQNSYPYMFSNINDCNHGIYYHPNMHGISNNY